MEDFIICQKCGKETFHTKSKCDFCNADLNIKKEKPIEKKKTETKNISVNKKTPTSQPVNIRNKKLNVTVTDIEMPFSSMVVFMVKWVIASIPALIILFGIFVIGTSIFGGILASIR